MSTTDELLRNNETYAAAFDKADLPLPPGRKVAVVACMDARLNVYGALGLQDGDAHVTRNAGSRRAPVDRPDQGFTVHPPQGQRAGVRL